MSCVHCAQTLKLLDSFVTQGDKEEMVTETVEELVSLSRMLALLLCRLPFLPCLLALRKNRALSKSERDEHMTWRSWFTRHILASVSSPSFQFRVTKINL